MSVALQKTMSQSSQTSISLYDFVTSTPAPVTRLLVELSPLISHIRWIAQVVSWNSGSSSESWLFLGVWWGLCLSVDVSLRYLLPALIIAPIALQWIAIKTPFMSRLRRQPHSPPTTEGTISQVMTDVQIIQGLLPRSILPALNLPLRNFVRLLVLLWVPYIIITWVFGLKVIIAIMGTVLLSWRSPWARACRSLLSRSGWTRWAIKRIWSFLTGIPSPVFSASAETPPATPPSPHSHILASLPPPAFLRFRFTVLENQRWWMGLDWTAALLPAERPSWSSPHPAYQPLPPPSSFSLPGPTTVFLPLEGHHKNAAGLRMKRTSKWKWEDGEWGVVVRTPGKDGQHVSVERVKMDPPKPNTDNDSKASKLADVVSKGLRRTGNASDSGDKDASEASASPGKPPYHVPHMPHTLHRSHSNEMGLTDPDGWIFADNKWEFESPKGGLGKYTRFRTWTRVAILEETVEIVPAVGSDVEPPAVSTSSAAVSAPASVPARPSVQTTVPAPISDVPPSSPSRTRESLRQRLGGIVGEKKS